MLWYVILQVHKSVENGMQEKDLDWNRYALMDKSTGEVLDMAIFVKKLEGKYWEKAYAKTLAEYIGLAGSSSADILAYMLKAKDSNNLILGTVREIAKSAGTAPKTVSLLFKRLGEKKLLKKVRSGCYMLSPDLLRYGNNTKGAMLVRFWGDL